MSLFAPSPGQLLFLPHLSSQSRATVHQTSQPARPGPCQPCPGPRGSREGLGQTSCASAGASEGRGAGEDLLWTPEPRPGGGIPLAWASPGWEITPGAVWHGDWVMGGLFRQSDWRVRLDLGMGVSPRPLDVHHGSEDLGIFIGS